MQTGSRARNKASKQEGEIGFTGNDAAIQGILHRGQCAAGSSVQPDWYVGGSVLVLEIARIMVDECLAQRRN